MTVDITYDEMNILNLNGLSLESVQGDIAMKRAGGMSDDDIRADYTSLINELKPLTTTSANDTAKIQNWQNKGAITPFEYGQRNSIQYDNIKGKEAPIDTATRTLGEVSKQAESYLYNFDAALGTANRLIGGIARNRVLHEKDLENSETSDKKIGFAEAFRNTFKSGEWLPFVGGFLSKNGFDAKREREIEKKIRNGEALYESDLDFINYRINKRQEENVRGVSVGGHIAESFLPSLVRFGGEIATGQWVLARLGMLSELGQGASTLQKVMYGLGDMAKTGLVNTVLPTGWNNIYENYQGRMLNNELSVTDKGEIIFRESYESPAKAFLKSLGQTFVMFSSEASGQLIGLGLHGVGAAASKYVATPISKYLASNKQLVKFTDKVLPELSKLYEKMNNLPIKGKSYEWLTSKVKFDGFFEELGEEVLEDVLNLTIGTNNEERTLENYAKAIFKSPDEWAVLAGAIALQGGTLSAASHIIGSNMEAGGASNEEIIETLNNLSEKDKEEIIFNKLENNSLSLDELSLSNKITQNIKEEIKSKAVQNGVSEKLGEKASNLLTNILAVRADDNDRDITELYEETAPNIVFSDDDVTLKGGVRQDTVLNQPMNNNVENEFGQTQEELAEMFKADIQNILNENNVETDEFDIEDVRIYGSYTTGKNKDTSDLDVIVQYSGTMKEDAAFNLLHDTELTITDKNGVERVVDINPINRETSGTIDEHIQYMNNLNNAKNYNSFEDFVNEFSENMEETPEDYKINNLQDVLNDLGITEDTPLVVNTPTGTVSVRVSSIEHIVNGGDSTLHNPDKSRYKSINRMLAVLERPEIVISDENGKKKYIKLFKGNNKTKSQIAVVYNDVNGDYVYTTIPVTKHKKYILKEVNSGNVIYKKGQTRENISAANNIITDNSENFKPQQITIREMLKDVEDANGNVYFQPANIAGAENNEVEVAAKEWQEKGTDSKYFKKWFGDSVVKHSSNDKPLIVYHGTDFNFSGFIPKGSFDFPDAIYFSSKKSVAKTYTNNNNIMECYLKIENPYIVDAQKQSYNDFYEHLISDMDYAVRNGYDGVIIRNIRDNWGQDRKGGVVADTYIVFNPEQIKSVNNRGTFDGENANIYYQPAYNGSPSRFDNFSTDYIGTGEGNQAHGWGLYFAKNKNVSEGYRERLTYGQYDKVLYKNEEITDNTKKRRLKAIYDTPFGGKNFVIEQINDSINEIQSRIDRYKNNLNNETNEYQIETYKGAIKSLENEISDFKKDIEFYKNIDIDDISVERNQGQLYEVDIPEDDVLLDEDKKFSEQPKQVQHAFRNLLNDEYFSYGSDFKQIKEDLVSAINDDLNGKSLYKTLARLDAETASKTLNKYGIKGIKYNGQQDGECYVIFDDKAVEILKTYYQPEFVSSEQLSVYPDVNTMREAKAKGAYIPVKNLIQLFKNADESTIVHELGHWYLQCLVEDAQHSEKAKTKLDAVRSFLKNNGEEFSNAQQEKFARGFEAYVRSGYARTNRLKKVFEDFKNALLNIYDDIKDMFWYENGVEQHFTDEDLKRINPLFERLMSTENERIQATVFKRVADINEQKQEIKKHQVDELYELEEMTQNNIEVQQQKERNKELKQYYLDLADKMTSREPKAVKEYKKRYKEITLSILEYATGKDRRFVTNPKNYEKIEKLIETTDKISSGDGFLSEWSEFYADTGIGIDTDADSKLAQQALDNLSFGSFIPLDYQEDDIDIFYKRFDYLLNKLQDVKGNEKDAVLDALFETFDTMPQMPDYLMQDVIERLGQANNYIDEKRESIAKRYTALSLTQQYRMYIADKLSKTKIYDPVQKKQIRIGEINKLYRLIENTTTLLEAQNAVRAINEYLINQLEYRQKAILHKEIQKQININSKAIKVGALRKGKFDWRTNTIFKELEEINRKKPEELQKQLNIIAQTDKMAENEERENVNENTAVSSMPGPQNEREKIKLEFTEYKSKKLNELNVAHTSKLLADILRLKFEGRRAKDEQEFYRNLETFKTKTNIADVITKKLSNNKVAQYLARWVGGDTLFTSEGTLANWESLLNAIADKETAQEFSLLYDEAQAEVYANNKMLELQNIIAKTYGFEKSEGAKKVWNKMLDFNEMQQVINLFKQYDKEFVTLKVASYNKHTGEISYSDLEVTRSQNMMFYGWAQNKQLHERLVNMFGENQLQYMFSFLSAQDKKLMFNLMDFCDSMYEDTNEVFINITGLSLPKVENYLPSKAERTLSDLDMLQEGIQNSSVSNFSATKDRKNCSKIRMKAVTPLEVIIPHINKTARYVVLAEKLTNFRKIFVDAPEIKDALKNVFKKNAVTNNLPINYDYIHFEGDKSKVIDLKINKDIKVDSIKPVEVLPFLPFELHDKPSENKHEIINALELTEGKQRKRTNNNTNETVIINRATIEKSLSNRLKNNIEYGDLCKIVYNIEELFETSQKIISHKSYKGDADLTIDRYANIARIDNNEYLLEFVVKNGEQISLYSVNMVDSNKKAISTNVSELPSTPDMTNNSITYIQNLFKSRLVERYNEDYKEEQKRLKENKNKGKKQEKDKGIVTAEKLYKILINQLSTSTFDNYAKSICVSKNIYDYIANNWISASVGGNLKVLISQLTSVINYSENMPVNEWSDGFRKAILNPKETINYMLDNCDYLKSRLAGNSQNEIMSQLTNEADRFRTLRNFATVNTRYGDIAAIVFGGKPYVDYLINEKGLPKEDAFKRFVESTLRSQQSGHNSATSAWQKEVSRNWLTRMFFAFNNTNMQYERKFIDSVSQLSKGDITKEEFLKVFLIYKVFNPILFTSIIGELSLFHLIRGIFGGDDDELKKGELSMLFASLLSNWGGYGFTGKIANSIAKITIAKKMNDKYFDSDVPLLGTVEDITKKLFKKDGLGFADYIDILASAADYATPIPTSRALTILGGVGDMFRGEIGIGALELLGYGNYRATVGATGKEPKRR